MGRHTPETPPLRPPEKLTEQEAKEIVRAIGDHRLRLDPEHVEYFIIATPRGTHYSQRLRTVGFPNEDGTTTHVRIEDYLRGVLTQLDQEALEQADSSSQT